MTILERVRAISKADISMEADGPATIEKMIYMAYWIGREEATRSVSDMYNAHLAEQRKRADACRYHHLANEIIGPERYLYSCDYAMDMTDMFGNDPADA